MPRIAMLLLAVALACVAPLGAAQLQPPRGLPGPTPPPSPSVADPWQALSFFEGNWTIAGVPAGARFDESCAWLTAARRHLVCRSRTESANGVQEGLGVFSYRAADGRYVYRSFEPTGEVNEFEGRLLGDTWQFAATRGAGPSQRTTRLTITPGGERSFRLSEEIAIGNGPFKAQPEIRYVPSVGVTSAR
ncbi:MAG TPA: hypothetical protein VFN64_11035 [Burkholderiaceae bacterium]|nr:hypothetical protein [Burkholderiaceae bacterium]